MLATLVIALREGLEAVLIVSIIAAFLRKNQQPLGPMWWGVGSAVLLSLVVGLLLSLTEHALPQAQQEAMETVIGAVAVIFVSSMILWMQQQAPQLRAQLEENASLALHRSRRWALPLMAFLAVLKEGFETSVFMLATFSAAQSAAWATAGAIIGLLLAITIGWGLYRGGIKINLARFFGITGLFLILVAAGLVISALRSAHEAGWLLIGQEKVIDLYWLIRPGSLQAALISGVLGIPADPRTVELVGWISYLAIFTLIFCWPKRWMPKPQVITRLYYAIAASAFLMVVVGHTLLPSPRLELPKRVPLVATQQPTGPTIGYLQQEPDTLTLALPEQPQQHIAYTGKEENPQQITVLLQWPQAPRELTLDQVVALYHQRVPPGLSPQQHPGPYQTTWRIQCHLSITRTQSQLTGVSAAPTAQLSLQGSGLLSPRIISVELPNTLPLCAWQAAPSWQHTVDQAQQRYQKQQIAFDFFRKTGSVLLLLLAIGCLLLGWQKKRTYSVVFSRNNNNEEYNND